MPEPGLRGSVALLACLAILVVVNVSIAGKERLLLEGRIVYLELAPVDPRSLMQGDYMALNYRLAEQLSANLPRREESQPRLPDFVPGNGWVVVSLDERSIASFARLDSSGRQSLAENEASLRYRVRGGQLKFASNAFFFQEGTASDYTEARYGQFRVADDGELLLTALYDENLEKLGE